MNRVTPGMTVQADIKTGKKTLLQTLIRPVYNAWYGAFREK
jgi:HlyD family secretion protein/adhesin transport system membrane fusion protein